MYAIRIPSLEDVSGFPVLIDGNHADNDPARYFVGGAALQRPSLTTVNGHIVAGFGRVGFQHHLKKTQHSNLSLALREIQLHGLSGQREQDSWCWSC